MIKHESVLLEECIEGLAIKPDGIYIDVTFGAGGHSKAIIEKLNSKGRLIAFDQDADVLANRLQDDRVLFVKSNFRFLSNYLDYYKISGVDGILADLGVSSHQFDTDQRGFSYRFDGALDMRMNQDSAQTAASVLNSYRSEELQRVFQDFGEVRNAKTLVRAVVESRRFRAFDSIGDFISRIEGCIMGNRAKYLAQVFQALRMEVNDEVGALKAFLEASGQYLNKDGRLVVITFHSIEDRIVKRFVKNGNVEDRIIKDDFGQVLRPLKEVNRKVILPSPEEIKMNSRSRSAKLRVAQKI